MHASHKSWARSHPVRLSAAIGAIVGFLSALAIEIGGALHLNSSSVVQMLLPAFTPAGVLTQRSVVQSVLILAVEFLANMLVYALLFSVPVALIVIVRRIFTSPRGQNVPVELASSRT